MKRKVRVSFFFFSSSASSFVKASKQKNVVVSFVLLAPRSARREDDVFSRRVHDVLCVHLVLFMRFNCIVSIGNRASKRTFLFNIVVAVVVVALFDRTHWPRRRRRPLLHPRARQPQPGLCLFLALSSLAFSTSCSCPSLHQREKENDA